MKPSLTQPALIGGLVVGVLSALPLIYVGNLCCCLWIISGGVVAAYLLQQSQTAPIVASDGALVGLLAGIVGAFVYLVVSIPINLVMAPLEQRIVQRLFETMNNMPPELREYATRSTSAGMRVAVGHRQLHLHAVSRGGFFHHRRAAGNCHLRQENTARDHRRSALELGSLRADAPEAALPRKRESTKITGLVVFVSWQSL